MSDIAFEHRVSTRARRISLKLNGQGEVVVVSPRFTPRWVLKQFVQSQADWIEKQRQRLEHSRQQLVGEQNNILIFGKQYPILIDFVTNQPPGVFVRDATLIINPYQETDLTLEANRKHVNRFLKKTARTYIEPRVSTLAKQMIVDYQKLQLREQSSRWGSCSHTGTLSLNWRLAHCPPPIIDYVLVHELAHLVHFDHSRAFWALVSRYDGAYREHRNWLKKHGNTILAGV